MKETVQMVPAMLRMPEDLRAWLKHKAIDNRRSLNGELIVRLEESRRQEQAKPAAATSGDAK